MNDIKQQAPMKGPLTMMNLIKKKIKTKANKVAANGCNLKS